MPKQARSPIAWLGGKYYSAAQILAAFPPPSSYTTYVELFGGAGHVLFRKPRATHVEVYNDLNGDLVNFWLMCRDHPQELQERIGSLPYSRQLHDTWHRELFTTSSLSDLERAVRWFYVLRSSFGGMLSTTKTGWSYSVRRSGVGHGGSIASRLYNATALFQSVSERLKFVQIEHQGYEKVIKAYQSPTTLFYCDPPYIGKEEYYVYKDVPRFTETDHHRLAQLLNETQAMVALSYYDHPLLDDLYPASIWRRRTWSTYKHVVRTETTRLKATELLLMNYPEPHHTGIS